MPGAIKPGLKPGNGIATPPAYGWNRPGGGRCAILLALVVAIAAFSLELGASHEQFPAENITYKCYIVIDRPVTCQKIAWCS